MTGGVASGQRRGAYEADRAGCWDSLGAGVMRRGGGGGHRGGGARFAGGGVHRGGAYRGRRYGYGGRYGAWAGRPGWYRRPVGGAIAAGAALGWVSAATASSWAGYPPQQGLCWYYNDATRHQGFWDWDVCP